MPEMIVQTAGRDALGEFSPEFAHYNDDILFGENWNNQDIDVKTRSIITVVALMSSGVTDSSLKYHLMNAKTHGVTQKEIAAILKMTPENVRVLAYRAKKQLRNEMEGDGYEL